MSVFRPIRAARRVRSRRGFKAVTAAGAATLLLATVGSGVSNASAKASQMSGSVDSAARAMLPASITKSGVLTDGVNLPNPPLEYQVNGTGAFTGFDIELARALAAKLGLKLQPENLAFTALLTSLDSGRVDIVLSGLFDTTARQAKYNIINYLNTGAQNLHYSRQRRQGTDACLPLRPDRGNSYWHSVHRRTADAEHDPLQR